MTDLRFLSPSRCEPGTTTSPLRRALDTVSDTDPRNDAGLRAGGVRHRIVDLRLDGKVELRGDLDLVEPREGEELVRLSPRRGFLFTNDDPSGAAERVRAAGVLAYDATGALAGLALEGEQLMRRLTDLDLDNLPAAGPFARVSALVLRDEGERFRVYVPQELAHDVALAILDALAGLEGVWLKPDPNNQNPGVWLQPDPGSQNPGAWLQPDPSTDPDPDEGTHA